MKFLKLNISVLFILLLIDGGGLFAQEESSRFNFSNGDESKRVAKEKVDSLQLRLSQAYVWKIDPRFGDTIPAVKDSSRVNFHQSTLVENIDVAVGTLGNLGSPTQTKIYFNRPLASHFIFKDGLRYWRKGPEDQLFLNTRIPYSRIHYQTGGGGQTKEERFMAELSSNFGKRVNVGFDFDYIYAREHYKNLYNKQVNYDVYGSYTGDKYRMHAFFANNNTRNAENGGIADLMYIKDPDSDYIKAKGDFNSSFDIPVRIEDKVWNRLRGRHLYVTNRYDLGENMEEYKGENDSIVRWRLKENYVAPASIIFTTHYTDQRREFVSRGGGTQMSEPKMNELYNYVDMTNAGLGNQIGGSTPNYKYKGPISDYMSYWSWKNTAALAMNEGFKPWMKFGLTAFVEYDMRKYLMPDFKLGFDEKDSESSLNIGGVLSSQKGKHLRYKTTVEKDLLNSDFSADGNIETDFSLGKLPLSVKANAYIKNISPRFFENKFSSKYWNWDLNLKDTKRFYVGGEIESKKTNTKISGGFESIQKLIYYGADGIIAQKAGNIQVMSLRLDQKLQAGILHWENQVVFQKSSDEKALPLPKIALYTNLYIQTKIAKLLTVQLGADMRFHTKYYAPGYEPLNMQFYNQREDKVGNFPMVNVYLNAQMKYARFFIMYYNAAKGVGKSGHFSLYRYAMKPSILKFGLSWSFNN